MALTDVQIRNARASSKPVKITDGGGLYLELRPSGSRLWRYRYRIARKENVYAIGEYYLDKRAGHVSLESARRARDEARALVRQGIHPSHQRKDQLRAQIDQNGETYEAVALEWISRKERDWSVRYAKQVKTVLKSDAFPVIGARPISGLRAADMLTVLRRVDQRGAPTLALLIRQWSSAIFQYAIATLRAEQNPMPTLQGAIVRPTVTHRKPLSRALIQLLFRKLEVYGGERKTNIALRLMLLTFVRTIELRAARWDEIDFSRAEWRIPAERMKMREEHIVPLSRQATTLLRDLRRITGNQIFLFPNRRHADRCMSATTLNRALERMGFSGKGSVGFSSHGFRATASTILNETGFRSEIVERQLAHKDRNAVRASYNQASYLEERRTMMQQWADMIDQIASDKGEGEARTAPARLDADPMKRAANIIGNQLIAAMERRSGEIVPLGKPRRTG